MVAGTNEVDSDLATSPLTNVAQERAWTVQLQGRLPDVVQFLQAAPLDV